MKISNLCRLLFLIYIVFCFCDAQERAVAVCHAGKGVSPGQVTTCESSHCEPVCLVCGDYLLKGVKWIMGDALIAQGEFTFGVISGSKVNKCHGNSSSLSFSSCHQRINTTIRCVLDENVLAEFRLEGPSKEIVTIFVDGYAYSDHMDINEVGGPVVLHCIIQYALPPVTMEWFVDEKKVYTETFLDYTDGTTNFSIPLVIDANSVQHSITCASYGNHMENMNQHINVSSSRTIPEPVQATNKGVIFAGGAVFILGCLLVCACFTIKKFRLTRNLQGNQNISSSCQMNVLDKQVFDTDQSIKRQDLLTEGSRKELPKIPGDEENSQNSHNSGESEPNYYSTTDVISEKDSRMLNENDISIIMNMKMGKIYKRWMGSVNLAKETNKCVVITTLTDKLIRKKQIHWEAFIRKCLDLPASNHLVKIEAISIQSNKLFLISEHLVCETMQDFLSRDTKDKGDYYCCSSLSVPDVIKHVAGILEGMDIIKTFGFLHPGLSIKKVLLTKEGQVKLFDFCLARDAPKIAALKKAQISTVTLNQFPPEMLLLNQYTESSDVWSTAVVIWEIMAAGNPPFPVDQEVRFNKETVTPSVPWPEKYLQIKDKILFDCWNHNSSLRPSIHNLRGTFVAIFEKLMADSSYEIPIPTTYLPMRAHHTAQPTYAEQIYNAGV
ncbi:uncharacterized protein [Apostichopus japonicus]|uniref:uncharacterized protein isoform X2 n=1 Tax=Stichopus japonicus TaxID=307972 RepID=UPI003AB5E108